MVHFIESIYNRKLEIHYNEKHIRTERGSKAKIELKGKVRCPLLNTSISSIVCSTLMDKPEWPRFIDSTCCARCNCFIALSINRYKKEGHREERKENKTVSTDRRS